MFKKKSEKPNPALVAQLQQKVVFSWTTDDVSNWIRAIGYGEHSAKFMKNRISGQELVTLTSSDLRAIGVSALGHQKSILAKVAAIQASSAPAQPGAVAQQKAPTESDLSSLDGDGSESGSSSATTAANRLEISATMGNAARSIVVKRSYKLDRVLAKMEDSYQFPCEIFHNGKLVDDAIQWADIVSQHYSADPLELEVKREDPNKIHKEEKAMLHGLTDACFIIDIKGQILFYNLAAEDILGYDTDQLIGQNIRDITPPEVKAKHDQFLRRYLETGNAKVIGSGRHVQVIHKQGHEVSCWLSVTEQKKASGRHTFMGTLHEIKSRETSIQSEKFAVLDGVQEAILVINSTGVMQFMNGRMEKLLGYNKDVIGRNVSFIMPEPYSSAHDSYLRNYLKSGTPKIIGKGGRIVTPKHANGSVLPVHLEVDEVILENQRYFVGSMVAKDARRAKKVGFLEKTRNVVEMLAVPAIVISSKGIVQAFNAQAAEVWGHPATDVVGQNVKMLMNDSDAARHDDILKHHMATGEAKIIGKFRHVQAKHKNGKLFDVKLSVAKSVDPDDMNNVLFTGTAVVKK